jgi:hypothetical protein
MLGFAHSPVALRSGIRSVVAGSAQAVQSQGKLDAQCIVSGSPACAE